MTVWYGPEQTFVRMNITLLENGVMKFGIKYHIKDVINDFPEECSIPRINPIDDGICIVSSISQLLDSDNSKLFHSIFAKFLFVSHRTRSDIQVFIGFLGTRVTCATEEDWVKLKRVLEYLRKNVDITLTL